MLAKGVIRLETMLSDATSSETISMKTQISRKTPTISGKSPRPKPAKSPRCPGMPPCARSTTSSTGRTMKSVVSSVLTIEAILRASSSVERLTLLVTRKPMVPRDASSGSAATVSS